MLFKGIVTQVSGSIGGITGSHNRGGLYFRARAIPVDPGSVLQQTLRSAMATLAARWRDTLTEAQRDAWRVYAANTPLLSPLGDPRDVGGLPMYERANVIAIQTAHAVVDDPAVSGLPELSPPTSVDLSSGTGTLTIGLAADPWTSEDGAFLAVYASRPLSESIGFFKGPYRLIGSVDGDSVTPPTSFTGSYADVWGTPPVGAQVRVQLRVVDSFAALSAAIRDSTIVSA